MKKKGIRIALCMLVAAAMILPVRSMIQAGFEENVFRAKVVGASIEIKWPNDGLTHEVLMANEQTGPYSVIGYSDTGSFTYRGATRTTAWFAERIAGAQNAELHPICVTMPSGELSAPTKASAQRLPSGRIRLTWGSVRGAQEYEVLLMKPDGTSAQVALTSNTSVEVDDMGMDYGVRSWNGAARSNITTIPCRAVTTLPSTETDEPSAATAQPTLAPTPEPTREPQGQVVDGFDARSLESAVFAEINARRTKLGLPVIQYNAKLQEAARFRAKELADYGYFEHKSKSYKKLEDCAEAYTGRRPWWVAECLMWGSNWQSYNSAVTIVDLWRNSAAHWEALTTAEVSEGGVGVALNSKGEIYVCAFPVQWKSR